MPQPSELVEDNVYNSFVSPFLRAERLQTERERERADQHQEQAKQVQAQLEQECQRSNRYAAILESMGVSVDKLDNKQ